MGRAVLALLLAGVAWGQIIIEPAKVPESLKHFVMPAGAKPLRCDASYIRPVLNFSLRFQAGYLVRVPMDQYLGPGHVWIIWERITPENDPARAVYLGDKFILPDVPKTNIVLPVVGGYLLGEGRYRVEWMMWDDQGRVALKQWTLEAERSHANRNVKMAMAPGSVAEFSLRGAGAARAADDAAAIRLTVLMNAAPISWRRMRLRATDQIMLLGGLSALLERVPTKSVRLVVFNLDQQQELYRSEHFAIEDLDQVGRVLNQTELGRVDFHVLQRPKGHLDFLAGLMNREVREAEPSDVVLVLGPRPRYTDKIPAQELERAGGAPRFLYLQYQPFLHAPPEAPDTIRLAVKALRGKTLVIRTPADFAKGIEQVERK
ncbi:MAG TPA: hypothetical protein VME43_27865 [Bryobacteraceae bacterium]|nr:hypothetical protein [Bryobacteraceae bacterium]